MNTSKLKEIVEQVLNIEARIGLETKLSTLTSSLNNLAASPSEASYQTQVASSLETLLDARVEFRASFPPQEFERFMELASDEMSEEIDNEIRDSIRNNAMSPSVAAKVVSDHLTELQGLFEEFTKLHEGLDFFKFSAQILTDEQAEIGFQIPRDIFDNSFAGLVHELGEIRKMMTFFSIVTLGKNEEATVGNISTTDPLFYLETIRPLATAVAAAVSWGIAVWASVEQIRKVRAQTAQIKAFTEKEVEDIFGKKIKTEIETLVDEKVKELIDGSPTTKNQKGELVGQLNWALNSLLAKLERGMTVELRIPPPQNVEEEGEGEERPMDPDYQELLDLQARLVFPRPSESPILEIPKDPDT